MHILQNDVGTIKIIKCFKLSLIEETIVTY